jgi:hypothetical protein
MAQQDRKTLLGKLRLGMKRSCWSESRWCSLCGGFSFEELSEAQARMVLQEMTIHGLLFGATFGQTGRDAPTAWHWKRFTALGKALGWEGMNDPAAVALVRREVGVDHPRFLTRRLMHQALAALRAARDAHQVKIPRASGAPKADRHANTQVTRGHA